MVLFISSQGMRIPTIRDYLPILALPQGVVIPSTEIIYHTCGVPIPHESEESHFVIEALATFILNAVEKFPRYPIYDKITAMLPKPYNTPGSIYDLWGSIACYVSSDPGLPKESMRLKEQCYFCLAKTAFHLLHQLCQPIGRSGSSLSKDCYFSYSIDDPTSCPVLPDSGP